MVTNHPFLADIPRSQKQHLHQALAVGEAAPVLGDFAELAA